MDASIDRGAPLALFGPGRFTRVSIQTSAGEIEAKLSEAGNWELRLRRDGEHTWRLACRGDLEGGAFTAETRQAGGAGAGTAPGGEQHRLFLASTGKMSTGRRA